MAKLKVMGSAQVSDGQDDVEVNLATVALFCLGLICLALSSCAGNQTPSTVEPAPTSSLKSNAVQPNAVQSSPVPEQAASPTPPTAGSSAQPSPAVQPSTPPLATASESPSILSKIRKDLSEKVTIAKQDAGKTYLGSLLMSQQAEKITKGRFSSDLKRLSGDVPLETDEYRIEVRQANASQAVMVAIAKQTGFASYSGIVYALEGQIPATSICKTNVPSQTPPPPPKRVKDNFICESGSSTVN